LCFNGDSQRQLFLTTLLDDSLYTKKWASGRPANLLDLFKIIDMCPEATDLSRIYLSSAEKAHLTDYIEAKKQEIRTIQQQTISLDNRLSVYFNEAIARELSIRTTRELQNMPSALRKYCRVQVGKKLKWRK